MSRHNPRRPFLRTILAGCALMLVLFGPAPASVAEQQAVEADGAASIQGGNLAQARDQAISHALRSAIEKVIASSAAPDLPAGRKALLHEKIFPSTERYIVHFRILREAELDGAYAVRIAATVDAAGLRGDLRRHGILAGKAEETRGAERRIMLSVRGSFAGHHDYLAFRDMISGIPGVQSATPASIAPRLSEWHLRSSEGAQGIARELSKRRFKGATLRIVQSGEDAIVVSLDSKGGNRD
ncbi:MAG: hypothetical protein KBA80_05060 [Syntrophobacterales bacterium]|nr:hypothetical protein [Syntrophobacterales bacterium]